MYFTLLKNEAVYLFSRLLELPVKLKHIHWKHSVTLKLFFFFKGPI